MGNRHWQTVTLPSGEARGRGLVGAIANCLLPTMPREHTVTVRVRYSETDQMGVVYHPTTFSTSEMRRTELCRRACLQRDGGSRACSRRGQEASCEIPVGGAVRPGPARRHHSRRGGQGPDPVLLPGPGARQDAPGRGHTEKLASVDKSEQSGCRAKFPIFCRSLKGSRDPHRLHI